ncbi:MAG: hypothetical protein ACI4XM_04415 [Candidatus Coprovivens sp.]
MVRECTGKEVNSEFLRIIDQRISNFVNSKSISEELITDYSAVIEAYDPVEKQTKMIYADKEDEYKSICDFRNYINFNRTTSDNVYEIPGIKIKNEDNPSEETKITIYLPIENIKNIVKILIEKKDLFNGIEFPQELYQIYYDNIIPGTEYEGIYAPLPKKLSETDEEYEAGMEQHYREHGINREELETYRKPYPHENVDYRDSIGPIMTDTPRESYIRRVATAIPREIAEPEEETREGERRRVVDIDLTIGQILRQAYLGIKGVKESKDSIKKIASMVGGTIIVGFSLVNFPIITLGLLGSSAAIAGLGLGYKNSKNRGKLIKAIKKKFKDFFKGKPLEEVPENGEETQTLGEGDSSPAFEEEYDYDDYDEELDEEDLGHPGEGTTTTEEGEGSSTSEEDEEELGHSGEGTTPPGGSEETPISEDTYTPEEPSQSISDDLEVLFGELEFEFNEIKGIEAIIKKERYILESMADDNPHKSEVLENLQKMENELRDYYLRCYDMIQQYVAGKSKTIGGPTQ